jgi:hypothetical protein
MVLEDAGRFSQRSSLEDDLTLFFMRFR